MNLFLACSSREPLNNSALVDALTSAAAAFPAKLDSPKSWVSSDGTTLIASVAHPPDLVGGVRYMHADADRSALFAGRPIRWTGSTHADGCGPLDPATYHAVIDDWLLELDGRFAVARGNEDHLDIVTDPLGGYPIYATDSGGATYVSNVAGLLADIRGDQAHDESAVAHLLSSGFSAMRRPLWADVYRLQSASHYRFRRGEQVDWREYLPTSEIASYFSAGFDPDEATAIITASTAAMIDWPGRPAVISATGGRDSRLVFAAAKTIGKPLVATTVSFPDQQGYPRTEDVKVAEKVSRVLDVPFSSLTLDDGFGLYREPKELVEAIRRRTAGAVAVNDAYTMRFRPEPGVLPLTISGLGGEIARGYYGQAEDDMGAGRLADYLFTHTAFTWPAPITSSTTRDLVISDLEEWIEGRLRAGVAPADIPDAYYFSARMGAWAAQGMLSSESNEDLISPLWVRRLLPLQFGLTRRERALEVFHLETLRRLNPQLVGLPFEKSQPGWPSEQRALVRRAAQLRVLSYKGRNYAKLKVKAAFPFGSQSFDPFPAVHAYAADRIRHAQPAVLNLLDQDRLSALLASDPAGMHARARYQIGRLASVL